MANDIIARGLAVRALNTPGSAAAEALAARDGAEAARDEAKAAATAAAVISSAPVTYGSNAGGNNGYNGAHNYVTNEPVRGAGLLTTLEWRWAIQAGTCNIGAFDAVTRRLHKKWLDVPVTVGLNSLSPSDIAGFNAPVGTVFVFKRATGIGNLDHDNTVQQAQFAFFDDPFATAEGDTIPAGGGFDTTAGRASVRFVVTPANAQEANARIDRQDASRSTEGQGYLPRERESYLKKVGVTAVNPAITGGAGTNSAVFSEATEVGGQSVSAFLDMQDPGAGYIVLAKPTDKADELETIYAQPTPYMLAGGNTLSLPDVFVPKGGRIGYLPFLGGGLKSPGFIGRQQVSAAKASVSLTVGARYAASAVSAPAQIGMTLRAPRSYRSAGASDKRVGLVERGLNAVRLPRTFEFMAFNQPKANIATWKSRGVRLFLFGYADDNGDPDALMAEVAAQGVYYVRRPGRAAFANATASGQPINSAQRAQIVIDAEYDQINPNCYGFGAVDEFDFAATREGAPGPVGMLALERELARIKTVAPTKPIWANLTGNGTYTSLKDYWDALNVRGPDVWGVDTYPSAEGVAPWRQFLPDDSGGGSPKFLSTAHGVMLEQLSADAYPQTKPLQSNGKPTFGYMHTSTAGGIGRAPLPWEFRVACWSMVIGGAIAIGLFPQAFSPVFSHDDTGPAIVAEIASIRGKLDIMQTAGVLMDTRYGGRIGYQKRMSAALIENMADSGTVDATRPVKSGGGNATFGSPVDNQMHGGFEGLRIVSTSGVVHYLVLNLLGEAATLNDAEWGITGLSFGAAEAKLLRATDMANLFA